MLAYKLEAFQLISTQLWLSLTGPPEVLTKFLNQKGKDKLLLSCQEEQAGEHPPSLRVRHRDPLRGRTGQAQTLPDSDLRVLLMELAKRNP